MVCTACGRSLTQEHVTPKQWRKRAACCSECLAAEEDAQLRASRDSHEVPPESADDDAQARSCTAAALWLA
jgi:hypothetical protein